MNKPRPDKNLEYGLALLVIGIAFLLTAQAGILAVIAMVVAYAVAPDMVHDWLGMALAGIMAFGVLGFLWTVVTVMRTRVDDE